ncbi:MaoC family dehydratase [Pseudopelagicola sp. nBUS_19]|uniref:MaoC family dehydratase n=1 Tax=unclassified Pseudopelagicola TaxID=2649563 RepID=UPI003EBCEE2F
MSCTPQTAMVGDELPHLSFGPITRSTLALYAGASGDHNPIHIDSDYATKIGLDDVIVHGMLSMAQFGRLVSNWAGTANLINLSSRFTAMTPVGATLTCQGTITERFTKDAALLLRVRLSASIEDGTETLKGSALIRVP